MTGLLLATLLHFAAPPDGMPMVLAQGRESRDGGTQRPAPTQKRKKKKKDEGNRSEEE